MNNEQTLVWLENEQLCMRLKRRKNQPNGSGILRRACTCKGLEQTGARLLCPVHMLWHNYFNRLPAKARPWAEVSSSAALARLREDLKKNGVPNAECYWTHDLRRGHADVCYISLCMFHLMACLAHYCVYRT